MKVPRIHRRKTGSANVISFDLPVEYHAEYAGLVSKCKKDDLYDLELTKPVKRRTTGAFSQNHRANSHIAQICEETGNDFSDLKCFLKRRAFRRGLPFMTRKDGSIVYSLIDGEPMPISESKMTTVECGYFIDEINQFAAELGISLRETE
jgi:hypothetical protein